MVPRSLVIAVLALSTLAATQPVQSIAPPYRDAALPIDARVRDLLARMTLEEKFWQLFMIPGDLDNPANDYSHGVFGLQIGTGRDEDAPPRPAADSARAH